MARTNKKPIVSEQALFCGLDLSLTATGIVVIDQSGTVVFRKVLKNKLRGMERIQSIRKAIADVYAEHSITFTCIEGYSMGSKGGRAFDIGELGGVIKLFLWSRKHDFYPIPPTQVKKYACNNGTCQKNMVILAVFKEWAFTGVDDNECDAFVLAQIARAVKRNVATRRWQADIIIKVRKEIKDKLEGI